MASISFGGVPSGARALRSNRSPSIQLGPPATWNDRSSYARMINKRSGTFVMPYPPGRGPIDPSSSPLVLRFTDATSNAGAGC